MKELVQDTADTTLDYVHINHYAFRKALTYIIGAFAEGCFGLGNGFAKAEMVIDPDLAMGTKK